MTGTRHRFHSICPYFAMFPETFVRRNLLAWSTPNDIVLDPFCGRGTTIFESLLNGRRAVGCDVNPVAFCLSRAKAAPPTLDEVLDRISAFERKFPGRAIDAQEMRDEFFGLCFHKTTLRQLLYLRDRLKWRERRLLHRRACARLPPRRKPSDRAVL
jgi:hypothetical protein